MIIEQTPYVTMTTDLKNDQITFFQKKFFDYDNSELKDYNKWLSNIHPDDRERFEKCIQKLINKENSSQCMFKYKSKDNSYLELEGCFTVSKRDKGSIEFISTIFDISEKIDKQKQLTRLYEKLKEEEIRKNLALKSGTIGIWELDLKKMN